MNGAFFDGPSDPSDGMKQNNSDNNKNDTIIHSVDGDFGHEGEVKNQEGEEGKEEDENDHMDVFNDGDRAKKGGSHDGKRGGDEDVQVLSNTGDNNLAREYVDNRNTNEGGTTIIDEKNNINNNENIDDDEVQILNNNNNNNNVDQFSADRNKNDKQSEEEQQHFVRRRQLLHRRKRRRQLHRMLQKPGVVPSFMAVISKPPPEIICVGDDDDDDDDDEDECEVLPMVVIDVDKYIGLKDENDYNQMRAPTIVPSMAMGGSSSHSTITRSARAAAAAAAKAATTSSSINNNTTTPAEEGWYEGTRIIAMPEDHVYLGEMQQWVRQNLEYFSATQQDVQMSQAGRRTPTVIGKVGIRCIHCARASLNSATNFWPQGAVSYPLSISGLHSACTQKPQLHFEKYCPFIPNDSKLKRLLQDSRASQMSSTTSSSGIVSSPSVGSKRKRMPQGISALMYYTISCQRIGIVESPTGLRFGRDLSSEPLPFETIRLKVEHEQPHLVPKQYQQPAATTIHRTTRSFQPETTTSDGFSSPTRPFAAAAAPDQTHSNNTTTAQQPVVADEACQQILKEALDSLEVDSGLVRKSDRTFVSDFIFLTICQMKVSHASQTDLQTRGKKTKLMRVGLTGFCCKNCSSQSNFCCRSFSSAPDNLASSITNSLVLHLLKCPYTPRPIQRALSTLKRIHTSQMNQLPYGSQRKLFAIIWHRLRLLDKDPSEMPAEEKTPPPPPPAAAAAASTAFTTMTTAHEIVPSLPRTPKSRIDPNQIPERKPGFPVSSDEATLKVLKEAEDVWDTATNNDLITPDDRNLVTDYVFLTMRQLKVATPTPGDFRGNRRNNVLARMAGMCCIHCAKDPSFTMTPSGRSFPSAPDNMASALNSSLYNHMQQCPYLPPTLKHAFAHLKKLHSAQCSSLAFGAQRRYFNKVYAKLKQVPISLEAFSSKANNSSDTTATASQSAISSSRRSGHMLADADSLLKYAFVKRSGTIPSRDDVYQCVRCRMVPLDFRAIGAVHFVPPTVDVIQKHSAICRKDGMDFTYFKAEYKQLLSNYSAISSMHDDSSLMALLRSVVDGNEDLVRLFSSAMTAEESVIDAIIPTNGAWRRLPLVVDLDKVESAFEKVAQNMGLPSTKLSDHPTWIRFLQMISPGLDCQRYEEERAKQNAPTAAAPPAKTTPTSIEAPSNIIPATAENEKKSAAGSHAGKSPSLVVETKLNMAVATSKDQDLKMRTTDGSKVLMGATEPSSTESIPATNRETTDLTNREVTNVFPQGDITNLDQT